MVTSDNSLLISAIGRFSSGVGYRQTIQQQSLSSSSSDMYLQYKTCLFDWLLLELTPSTWYIKCLKNWPIGIVFTYPSTNKCNSICPLINYQQIIDYIHSLWRQPERPLTLVRLVSSWEQPPT